MRLRIVVQDPAWLARARADWSDLLVLCRSGVSRMGQMLCGLRGHDYVLKAQRRRLSLYCRACGHTTAGWDLSDPTPTLPPSDRPRFLELLRKRS